MKPKVKKIRKLKGPLLNVARSMGKWRPEDDYLLIKSLLHLKDIKDVHKLAKFTNRFDLNELEERWNAFLYDQQISKMIRKNIKKLHVDDLSLIEKQVPFSDRENFLILGLDSKIKNKEFLDSFLLKNRHIFHSSRTVSDLMKQYTIFKKLSMLKDQIMVEDRDGHSSDNMVNFETIETSLNDEDIDKNFHPDENLEHDMNETYESLMGKIKKAEAELFLWQGIVDRINGIENPFESGDCLAVVYCEHFSHTMVKPEITFGRSKTVDVDLSSYELFSKKISRNQFKISMMDPNVFVLYNIGKMQVYVDGKIIQTNRKTQIFDKSVIEENSQRKENKAKLEMSAESHRDFSTKNVSEINESSKIVVPNSEKNYLNAEEKTIFPINHIADKANDQAIRVKSRKKRRPKQIIIIETPSPRTKSKMKKVHVKYASQPKTLIRQIQPELPTAQGPKTLSLIRNTPKYRPVIVAQPQPLILTQVAVPLIKVPVYGQNFQLSGANQANKINPNTLASNQIRNFPSNLNQNFPPPAQKFGNQPIFGRPGPAPGYNNFSNTNTSKSHYAYGQQIIKQDSEKDVSERELSPIMLFHDQEDDEQIKKGNKIQSDNGESLNDESQSTLKSRQGAKSKFGRNKLDFISNLFDGYYYTNIDYGQDGSEVDANLIDKVQPLDKNESKKINYSNPNLDNQSSARFSTTVTNSSNLPPINTNSDAFRERQLVSNGRKFASGQVYPTDRMSQSMKNHSVGSLPQLSPRAKNDELDETRIKSSLKTASSKNSNNTKQKQLNYPRNSVLANY